MKGPFSTVIFYITFYINLCIADYDASYLKPNAVEENIQVPCVNDQECNEMELKGFTCIENMCTCKNSTNCKKGNITTYVTKIGQNCTKSTECYINQAFCNSNGTCECLINTVSSENKRRCLNEITSVGIQCEEDVQCRLLNGLCIEKQCKCPSNMHVEAGICLHIAERLSCDTHEDCLAIRFSKCKNGECVCRSKFVKSSTNNSQCVPKAKDVISTCSQDIQCSSTLGPGSICSNGLCICTDLYHFRASQRKCISNALLGETCGNHTDCHQPGNEERRLECIVGVCKCKSAYHEMNGYCVPSSPASAKNWSSIKLSDLFPFVASYFLFYIIV